MNVNVSSPKSYRTVLINLLLLIFFIFSSPLFLLQKARPEQPRFLHCGESPLTIRAWGWYRLQRHRVVSPVTVRCCKIASVGRGPAPAGYFHDLRSKTKRSNFDTARRRQASALQIYRLKIHKKSPLRVSYPKRGDFLLLSYLRTAVLYLVLILSIRLMGKRQIGQMEASEFVVTMLVANLASIPMQDGAIPLYSGLVPILTVLGLELVLSGLILHSVTIRRLFCGKPVILINNGTILRENLRRTRVTLDELMGHLRAKDVLDIRSVQYAILETDGSLSVFPYPKERPASAGEAGIKVKRQYLPVTIIEDGILLTDNLEFSRKNTKWLEKVLQSHEATRETTLLLTVDDGDNVVWLGKETT